MYRYELCMLGRSQLGFHMHTSKDAELAQSLQQQEFAQAVPVAFAVPAAQAPPRTARVRSYRTPILITPQWPAQPPGAPPGGHWVEAEYHGPTTAMCCCFWAFFFLCARTETAPPHPLPTMPTVCTLRSSSRLVSVLAQAICLLRASDAVRSRADVPRAGWVVLERRWRILWILSLRCDDV